jgi:benzoyl-CoA reductase subunit C
LSVLDKFHDIVNNPHQYAQDWKARTGGKVLGYHCRYVPEELVYATGVLPVRLLGSNQSETITQPYIFQPGYCTFCRDCVAQALQGKYDYLDGVMYALGCPHLHQAFLSWQRHTTVPYSYELRLPTDLQNRNAKKYIIGELEDCKRSLEGWTGKSINDQDLDKAIDIYNKNRRLMLSIYELMKAENPPATAVEVAEMALAGVLMDKEEHSRLLTEALRELSKRKSVKKDGTRIMLLGSVNNDISLISLLDSVGANVVIDDYCTGWRYYQTEVIPKENRLEALANRIIERPACPMKDVPERRRPVHISKLMDDYHVQGVIYTLHRLCDVHGLDYPVIESLMNKKGVPILKLELDYSFPVGQVRTRIEAFLEMIQSS